MIVWLDVPDSQAKLAKRKGAQLSLETGRWFVKDRADLKAFMQWMPQRLTKPTEETLPASVEAWIDPRDTRIGRKGRRQVTGATQGDPYANNLPTFAGKLRDNI
jgi:hypothetical protein